MNVRRILFAGRHFALDTSNGAAVANWTLTKCLTDGGFDVEVVCGTLVDAGGGRDPRDVLSDRGLDFDERSDQGWTIAAPGVAASAPPAIEARAGGVRITIAGTETHAEPEPSESEFELLWGLFERAAARFKPDAVVTYGGDAFTRAALAHARRLGVATVFTLHNFNYRYAETFKDVDRVIVPSRFAADHYRRALGLVCRVVPNAVDPDRVVAAARDPKYLVFVNPSPEKGVYAFARIADELGRRRPDVPILVVESRGTEETLVNCGIDLRGRGNVFLMSQTADPREFWRLARIALMPSLWWENQPLTAIEAMMNGVPVIGSNRGGLPETLGGCGVVLPLPDHLTPATRRPPEAVEVAEWVDAVLTMWDDPRAYDEQVARSLEEAGRWAWDASVSRWLEAFRDLQAGTEVIDRDFREFGYAVARLSGGPAGGWDDLAPPAETSLLVPELRVTDAWRRSATTWEDVPGMFDFAPLYDEMARTFGDDAVFVEVGCLAGRSTCYMGSRIKASGKSIRFYAVDTCLGSPSDSTGQAIVPSLGGSMAGILHGNLIGCGIEKIVAPIVTTSEEAARLFQSESVDFCFIDADHAYESVVADLRAWWPKIKPGGILAGHDYRGAAPWLRGVAPAVHDFFGVEEAGHPSVPTCWIVAKPRRIE